MLDYSFSFTLQKGLANDIGLPQWTSRPKAHHGCHAMSERGSCHTLSIEVIFALCEKIYVLQKLDNLIVTYL